MPSSLTFEKWRWHDIKHIQQQSILTGLQAITLCSKLRNGMRKNCMPIRDTILAHSHVAHWLIKALLIYIPRPEIQCNDWSLSWCGSMHSVHLQTDHCNKTTTVLLHLNELHWATGKKMHWIGSKPEVGGVATNIVNKQTWMSLRALYLSVFFPFISI